MAPLGLQRRSDYEEYRCMEFDGVSNNKYVQPNMADDALCPTGSQSMETLRTAEALEGLTDCDPSINLCPGLDGVTGVLIRKCNLERMGLALKDGATNPLVAFKTFQKKAVLQDIAKRGRDSDWNEHKAIIKAYPLEELLLVRDDDGTYGANYYMPFTEVAFKAVVEAIRTARSDAAAAKEEAATEKRREQDKREKQKLRDEEADALISPREWSSPTADLTQSEIEAMRIKENASFSRQTICKKRGQVEADVAFKSFTERVHSLKAPKKCPFVSLKQELDFALQAVPSRADRFCQAAGELPKTAEIQHEARLLTVKTDFSQLSFRKKFQRFFSRVAHMIEEALQQNETVDILSEQYARPRSCALPHHEGTSEGRIRETVSFSDLSHTKNKWISAVHWLPTLARPLRSSGELVACSAMENTSFDERVETPGRATGSLVLFWSLLHPLSALYMFQAPAVRPRKTSEECLETEDTKKITIRLLLQNTKESSSSLAGYNDILLSHRTLQSPVLSRGSVKWTDCRVGRELSEATDQSGFETAQQLR
ncbi:hypothetical protein Esti_006061 [Eimeria stiedai]